MGREIFFLSDSQFTDRLLYLGGLIYLLPRANPF